MTEKIVVELDGFDVEMTSHQLLFELLYTYGSNKIAEAIESLLKKDKAAQSTKAKAVTQFPTTDEADILTHLATAFRELNEVPILILEKE